MNKSNAKSAEVQGGAGRFDFLFMLKAVMLSYILSIAMLFIFSMIATYACLSDRTIGVLVNLVTAIGTLCCGMLSGRRSNRGGLISGAICGCIYTVLLCVIGGLITQNAALGVNTLTAFAIGIICGSVGGVVGINTKSRCRR